MSEESKSVTPPRAAQKPHQIELHGRRLDDPWHWLRHRDDPEVIAYLEAENRYTEAMTAATADLRKRLYDEMRGRIQETDDSVPARYDDWFYYYRTEAGAQYRIHCRKKSALAAPEEVILDVNRLAREHDYVKLGDLEPSPDHRRLAYSLDVDGSERFTLFVKDLATGELLADRIADVYYSVAWANDSRTLFYTVPDAARRPHQVRRHRLGTPVEDDVTVHREDDERFYVSVDKTRSRKLILIDLHSQVTSEVRYLDADAPAGEFQVVRPRRDRVEYSVDHHADWLYAVTNRDAVNFKVERAPLGELAEDAWQEVIPHRPEIKIEDVELFRRHMVVWRRERGLERLAVHDLETGACHDVAFDEPVYGLFAEDNLEFDTTTFRFGYSSMVTPDSVYDYDMDRRQLSLRKRQPVPTYDPSRYRTERTYARAADGAEIPISLVYREGTPRNGSAPCLLYGYGSYGATIDPTFSSPAVSLLDRGLVHAIAHVRGGGALGRPWYEAGKLGHKKNTFTDFIAAAEHLVAERYTSSERLAVRGGSAGGLLMGAVTNLRPELFAVVVAEVPFVDVVNTLLDASIPLTVVEWEEWGDPRDEAAFDYIRSYSPYDNVRRTAYPKLLVVAGLNDPRVGFWEPAKWTARLREMKTDDNVLLLKTHMGSGHHGASGRFDRLHEIAFWQAFVIASLGAA